MTIWELLNSPAGVSIPLTALTTARDDKLDLLALELGSRGGLAWPESDRLLAERRRREAVARDAGEAAMLGRVLAAWGTAGIDSLILKGAAVARTHYPASWTRPRADVDVLVPTEAFDAAAHVLRDTGFDELAASTGHGQRHFQERRGCRCRIDLHRRLFVPSALNDPGAWHR